jgi:ABC-type Mn2+/Zn2+ transport system permease subunit
MNPGVPAVDALLDPFRPAFMQRALAEVLVLAVPCGLVGVWVVTRRLAFLTHAVGHATFPALVIALLAGWGLFATSLGAAVGVAVGLGWLSRRSELAGGAAVGIVLAATLALGAVLVSDVSDPGVRANTLLFGSLLAVGADEIARAAVVAALALVATATGSRPLGSATFHRELSTADGLRPAAVETGLLVMIGATVTVTLTAAGSLLAASLLLVPAATARLFTTRVTTLQVAAVAVAAVDGALGLWVAYHLDAPPGAGIAAVAAAAFVLVAAARAVAHRRQLIAVPS